MLIPLCVLFHDHLPKGVITDHNSSLNQFVSDEMGCFMQTVPLLVALLLGNALIDKAQMDVAARLLLAYIPLGPYLIQLSIVPATTLEAAHMVDAALLVHSRCRQ
jgi:hypothetical protein